MYGAVTFVTPPSVNHLAGRSFLFLIEERTVHHDCRKDDEIEEHGTREVSGSGCLTVFDDAVCIYGACDKEDAAEKRHRRRHYSVERGQGFIFIHPEEYRYIECIKVHYRELRRIKRENSEPVPKYVRSEEVYQPYHADHGAEQCGVDRHLGSRINMSEDFPVWTLAAYGDGVYVPCIGDHKAVCGAQA